MSFYFDGGWVCCGDLRKIGQRLSRPHCSSGYGVPTLQGLVGGGWGRARGNWWAPEGEGDFFPTRRKRDKTRQDSIKSVIL